MSEISHSPEKETLRELERQREADLRAMEKRIAEAQPATKGAEFEKWAEKHVFGDKKRITIAPEHNQHLARVDDEGIGLLKRRVSDHYVAEDGSLWDCKVYDEKSAIDRDQVRDYSLMERAGYVMDTQGNRIEVKSVNYLFSNRAAAEANDWRLWGEAAAWYLDDTGAVKLLEQR
jgi:hypothetical protein